MQQLTDFLKTCTKIFTPTLLIVITIISFLLILIWFKLIRKNNYSSYNKRSLLKIILIILLVTLLSIAVKLLINQGTDISTSIGLIGAGLSFALQEVILSIAGWIMIIFSRPFKIGDRIEVNGIKGDVISIGVIKTTLMEIGEWVESDNYSGRIVQVSNATIFKSDTKNYSTDFPFVWDEIKLPIKYGSNIEMAEQLIKQTVEPIVEDYIKKTSPHWEKMKQKFVIESARVKPIIAYRLTDNWVEFTVRYITDYKKRLTTSHFLSQAIYRQIKKSNNQVQLSSTTVDIVGFPESSKK